MRALLEIAVARKWANVSAVLMGMSKAIEKRLWPFDNPLRQFELKMDTMHMVEQWADDYSVSELAEMSAAELGKLLHLNEIHGAAVRNAAKQFPTVKITYNLRPIGADVLKIAVKVERAFNWSTRLHGHVEPFWLWVEDHEGAHILQLYHLVFRQSSTFIEVDFVISVSKTAPPPSVTIRFVSDRWMGAEEEVMASLENIIMPAASDSHTPRLDIPYLPLSAVQNPPLVQVLSRRLHGFNAIQSQAFWSIVKTRLHALLCAPTGCGKSVLGQLAIWCVPEKSLRYLSEIPDSVGQGSAADFAEQRLVPSGGASSKCCVGRSCRLTLMCESCRFFGRACWSGPRLRATIA